MKIKKLGHCCLVMETKGIRIMTDPGSYSTLQDEEKNIDIILITHEHQDHLHIESLKKVLENNPTAQIVTNTSVGKILDQDGISYTVIEHGEHDTIQSIVIEGYGEKHAFIRTGAPIVQNTGYFIEKTLFYPGDALTDPHQPVEILALPVAGPWLKIEEVIEYAKAVKPNTVFPVHDGMFNQFGLEYIKKVLPGVLQESTITFVFLEINTEHEF